MKSFQIVNEEKFIEKMYELSRNISLVKMAKDIGVTEKSVERWMTKTKDRKAILPISENIKRILDTYNLKPKEIGATIIDIPDKDDFHTRLKMLMNEFNIECKDLKNVNWKDYTEKSSYSKTMFSKWINGKVLPSLNVIRALAQYFDVSVYYLLGETDIRNADNDIISKKIYLNSDTIDSLKMDGPNNKIDILDMEYPREVVEKSMVGGGNNSYLDVKDWFIQSDELFQTLRLGARLLVQEHINNKKLSRFMTTKSIDDLPQTFYDQINSVDLLELGEGTNPVPITPEEVEHLRIDKVVHKLFDDYVVKKITEADEKM